MYIKSVLLALIVVLAGGAMATPEDMVQDKSDRETVYEIIHDTIGWALTKDRARLESILAHDDDFFIFHPQWDGTIVGWDAFVKLFDVYMDPRFKATHMEIRGTRINFSRSGETAWFSTILDDFGEWDGRPAQWKDTRWTGVLERRDGKWLMVQMHFSFAADKVLAEAEGRAAETTSDEKKRQPADDGIRPDAAPIRPAHPNVRFVSTGPLRAVVFQATGTAPEPVALRNLMDWAGPRGLLEDPASFLLFGRNNPPPPPDGGEYGYELSLTVPEDMAFTDEIKTVEIPAAEYAVTRANLENMGARWEWLYEWVAENGFKVTGHGFEEHLTIPDTAPGADLRFDLWLPVERIPG